jgi:hypothetical protein
VSYLPVNVLGLEAKTKDENTGKHFSKKEKDAG